MARKRQLDEVPAKGGACELAVEIAAKRTPVHGRHITQFELAQIIQSAIERSGVKFALETIKFVRPRISKSDYKSHSMIREAVDKLNGESQ